MLSAACWQLFSQRPATNDQRRIGFPKKLFLSCELQAEGGAGLGAGLFANGEQDSGRGLNGATETEPGGERDAARDFDRHSGKIDGDQSKASALQEKVGGTECLLDGIFHEAVVGHWSLVVGQKTFGELGAAHRS